MGQRSGGIGTRTAPWVAGCLAALGVGCAWVLGIEDKELGVRGGGGQGATGELCANGIDDDGDGALDCADDECTDYGCAPAVPAGWNGPVTLLHGAAPPVCGPGLETVLDLHAGDPDVPQVSCTPCQCSDLADPCSVTVESFYGGSPCQAGASPQILGPFSSCQLEHYYATSARVSDAVPTGSCTPSGGELEPPTADVEWPEDVHLCQSSLGGGCEPGRVCAARAEAPAVGPCVYQAGDRPCPDGYSERFLARDAAVDRGCTPCECQPPACDVGSVLLYGGGGCGGQSAASVPLDGTCISVAPYLNGTALGLALPAGSPCTPIGGEGTKVVTPQDTTVCCAP